MEYFDFCSLFIVHCLWLNGENHLKKDEIIVGAVIFLFGAITALLSLRMPIGTFRAAGTGMFPLILGILLMILSGAFILRIFLQGRKGQVEKASVESSGSPMQLILFLGTMALAALFFNRLGYPLTSFLLPGLPYPESKFSK